MLIRLTRAMRLRAASLLALLYMLCVLAPAAAFAFGDATRAAHCLTDGNHGLQSVHVHAHEGGKTHVHGDGTIHDHATASDRQDHSSDLQCCGLVCLSALPASNFAVQTPALPAMIAVSATQAELAGKPPERLYRPPISSLSL